MAASAEIIQFPLPERPEKVLTLKYRVIVKDKTYYFLSALWNISEKHAWGTTIRDGGRLEGAIPGHYLALYAVAK